jgi:hypothetical protein
MSKIPKRLYGPAQLGNSTATRYTVPANRRTVVRKIEFVNPEGGSSRTITVSIGADAAGTRLADAQTIAPGERVILYGPYTLEAAEIIAAHASAASAIVCVIDGEEIALA